MNRTPTILSGLALLGVIILFFLHFSSGPKSSTRSNTATNTTTKSGGIRIAYVDIDSFESSYEKLKTKKEEFKAQQAAMEGELQRSAAQFQTDLAAYQRKAQTGTLTRPDAEATEKRLGQMQQTLEARRQSMSSQFEQKLQAFNLDLHRQMDEFLEEYTKDKNYDYVLSYTRSNPIILYGNKSLNITEDVIKGMNERVEKGAEKDTAKSK